MALSDPRELAEFADLLKIKSIVWDRQDNDQVDGLGSADVLVGELASPLWMPKITVDWMEWGEARRIEARLNSLKAPRQFYLCDYAARAPAADPDGSILGDAAVVIAAIGDDNSSVSFSGLPPNYQLTEGDKWHVDFSVDPVRRALFEISEPINASAEGLTPFFQVSPTVWPGIDVGTAVTLINPAIKAIILPGSVTRTTRTGSNKADGLVFSALQML